MVLIEQHTTYTSIIHAMYEHVVWYIACNAHMEISLLIYHVIDTVRKLACYHESSCTFHHYQRESSLSTWFNLLRLFPPFPPSTTQTTSCPPARSSNSWSVLHQIYLHHFISTIQFLSLHFYHNISINFISAHHTENILFSNEPIKQFDCLLPIMSYIVVTLFNVCVFFLNYLKLFVILIHLYI